MECMYVEYNFSHAYVPTKWFYFPGSGQNTCGLDSSIVVPRANFAAAAQKMPGPSRIDQGAKRPLPEYEDATVSNVSAHARPIGQRRSNYVNPMPTAPHDRYAVGPLDGEGIIAHYTYFDSNAIREYLPKASRTLVQVEMSKRRPPPPPVEEAKFSHSPSFFHGPPKPEPRESQKIGSIQGEGHDDIESKLLVATMMFNDEEFMKASNRIRDLIETRQIAIMEGQMKNMTQGINTEWRDDINSLDSLDDAPKSEFIASFLYALDYRMQTFATCDTEKQRYTYEVWKVVDKAREHLIATSDDGVKSASPNSSMSPPPQGLKPNQSFSLDLVENSELKLASFAPFIIANTKHNDVVGVCRNHEALCESFVSPVSPNGYSKFQHGYSRQIKVKVIAPADLPAGFRFTAQMGDEEFMATVPADGVKMGELFLSTYTALDEDGQSEVYPPRAVPEVGRWKDNLFNCFAHGCFHQAFLTGLFCPLIALAQIKNRISSGRGGPRDAFVNAIVCTVSVLFMNVLFLVVPQLAGGNPRTAISPTYIVISNSLCAFFVIRAIAETRTRFRKIYNILEKKECVALEDVCVSAACPSLAVMQMMRSSADYSSRPAGCCTDDGLSREVAAAPSQSGGHAILLDSSRPMIV